MLVDQDAVKQAAAGEPWSFYDLGHGLCAYEFFDQCAHRMAFARCDFYRAYLLEESLAAILGRKQVGVARQKLMEWLAWAIRARLAPFKKKLAKTIRHLEGVLAFIGTGPLGADEATQRGGVLVGVRRGATRRRHRGGRRSATYRRERAMRPCWSSTSKCSAKMRTAAARLACASGAVMMSDVSREMKMMMMTDGTLAAGHGMCVNVIGFHRRTCGLAGAALAQPAGS